jgi:VanZ family protein
VIVTGRQKITIAAFVFYFIALAIASHIPIPQIVYKAEVSDKWLHFLAYLNFVFLLWFSVRPNGKVNWRSPPVWIILISVTAYGGLDEFIQPYFGRTKDLYDFTANVKGILTGFAILTFMTFWQALLVALAITIFSITNLARANLSNLVPITDTLFNFFAYAFFAIAWIRFIKLYLPFKSKAILLTLALSVPILFMFAVKAGSLILGRHFGPNDLLFGASGIIAAVVVSYLAGLFNYGEQSKIPE